MGSAWVGSKENRMKRFIWGGALVMAFLCAYATANDRAEDPGPTQERRFSFATGSYCAEVDAKGMLKNVCSVDKDGEPDLPLVPQVDLFGNAPKTMGLRPILTTFVQVARNEIDVVYNAEKTIRKKVDGKNIEELTGETIEEAYKIRYVFEETEIRIRIVAKPAVHLGYEIGPAAQIVENLDNGKEMTLPPVGGARPGPLRSLRLTYYDGTQLLYRWTGPRNPMNPAEDGSVSDRSGKLHWGCRGVGTFPEYHMTFRVVPPKKPQRVLAAPGFTVTHPVPGAIFFDGEEPTLIVEITRPDYLRVLNNLQGDTLEDARIEYRILDHDRQELSKGSVPLDLQQDGSGHPDGLIRKTIPMTTGKRGYFEGEFRLADAKGMLRSVWSSHSFSAVQPLQAIEEERQPMTAVKGGWNEYYRNAFIGLGLVREHIGAEAFPEKGKYFTDEKVNLRLDERFDSSNANTAGSGVPHHYMIFGPQGLPWAKTPQDTFEVYRAILERYKDKNRNWETLNEPNIMLKPKEYLELYLKPLKMAAEKVDPKASIIGFATCGFDMTFIEEVYKLGGKDYFDGIGIHPYMGIPYDRQFVPTIQKLRRIMATYGDEKKPIWFTEGGFNWWNQESMNRLARNLVRRHLIQDQYDIPVGRDHYYMTSQSGYLQFWVMYKDGTLTSAAVATRARMVRLDGKSFSRNFGFGIPFAHANVYRGKTEQAVAVWTYDNTRTLKLKTDAARVEVYDMWGNPVEAPFKDGVVSVPASGQPTYVMLPAEATVAPVAESMMRNVADLSFGATVTASSEASPADLALDGQTFGGGWMATESGGQDEWLEVELPIPTSVNRCILYLEESSHGGCLRDLNLLGMVDGQYQKLAEVRNNRDAILDVTFPATTVMRFKVEVLAAANAKTTPCIYEFQLLAADNDSGDSALVNWALADNGGKASASSTWVMETEVPVPDPNNQNPNAPISDLRKKFTVEYVPNQAIDGKFSPGNWKDYCQTVWIDGTPGEFPDWLQVDLAGKKTITAVLVFVNNFHRWKPRETGISDAEVQVWSGAQWTTLKKISGNTKGVIPFVFDQPIETDKVRVMVLGSNDKTHSSIMEIQVLGPK